MTVVLGIAGYVVQNKASISANATQHQLVREAAEQHLVEDKAAKQLERAQLQNAEFVYPVGVLNQQFIRGFVRAAHECGLHGVMATWAFEFLSPPTQPYVTIFSTGRTEMFKVSVPRPTRSSACHRRTSPASRPTRQRAPAGWSWPPTR
jgi:hypothetical protein